MAQLVFARRIFPALGNANEFSLLSLYVKIAMSKTAYHISLKGYVGGFDFDRSDVDAMLAENEGKRVNVLIDQFATLIADCDKIKADLDKIDLNVAKLYAKKGFPRQWYNEGFMSEDDFDNILEYSDMCDKHGQEAVDDYMAFHDELDNFEEAYCG